MQSGDKFGARTGVALVVANMVGTGVFTSLGFQLLEFSSPFVILALWCVGGMLALCGALCYAELAARFPRSGGEYTYVGEIFHPGAGFVSGWVSATVGFAAPTALVAMTFGAYLHAAFADTVLAVPPKVAAVALVAVLAVLHCRSHRSSGATQQTFTAVKVVLIVLLCGAALHLAPVHQPVAFAPTPGDTTHLFTAAFAVSLIYVNYAYTGWNAATYITGELQNAARQIPRVLVAGTVSVAALYVLLNATFLMVAPMDEMRGRVEIGYVFGRHAFGEFGGRTIAGILALLLISTASAMTLAGPRVLKVIGEDYAWFARLARVSRDGIPRMAIAVQSLLAGALVVTSSFESVLVFTGFLLGMNTLLAVVGVLVVRSRESHDVREPPRQAAVLRGPASVREFRVPWYPVPPLIFVAITGWTLIHILQQRPVEGWIAIAVVAAGAGLYLLSGARTQPVHKQKR